jgi:hypothetical protein
MLPVITPEYRNPANNNILPERMDEIYSALISYISKMGVVNIGEISRAMKVEESTAKNWITKALERWREENVSDMGLQILWVKRQLKEVEDKYTAGRVYKDAAGLTHYSELTYQEYLSIKSGLYEILNRLEKVEAGEGDMDDEVWLHAFRKIKPKTIKILEANNESNKSNNGEV